MIERWIELTTRKNKTANNKENPMFANLSKKMWKMTAAGFLGGATLLQAAGGCDAFTEAFWKGFQIGWNLTAG